MRKSKKQQKREIQEACDRMLAAFVEQGLMYQDPNDPDNFIFTDLPEDVFAARVAVIEAACKVITLQ